MYNRKFFGTDGIRGKVGKSPITPDFILKLGWAAGKVLSKYNSRQIIIGNDTRISSYLLESALEAGLSAAGLSPIFVGVLPTPAIAYLVRTLRAEAGIVVSASHSSYENNGVKFFLSDGTKLSDEVERDIEVEMQKPLTCVESINLGRADYITDAANRYIEFCKSTFPDDLNLSGIKIVIDCANGATYQVAPSVFKDLGAIVIPIGVSPNGININNKCGSTDIRMLQRKVLIEKADLGLAFDGDGDRIIMVDHLGLKVDGDQIIYVITREIINQGKFHGGIVGTIMSNMGLELSLKRLGIQFFRTEVGDRYIFKALQEKGWKLGAESSGHIVLLNHTTTGDGLIASLQVLTAMIRNRANLHDLCKDIVMLPQILTNIYFNQEYNLLENKNITTITRQVEEELCGKGRVLIRRSGTEPYIRIMIESDNYYIAKKMMCRITNIIQSILNS